MNDPKIKIAEKRIKELTDSGDLRKLSDQEKDKISQFFKDKSKNRLETARLVYGASKNNPNYCDFSEVVAAAYYSMYYIVHSFLALNYSTKLRENVRGVHIITEYILLQYLVNTNKLAKHLYDKYMATLETTAHIVELQLQDFQGDAFEFVKMYDKSRSAREIFTYSVTPSVEEYHARVALENAEEFINTIRQMMIKKH